MKEYLLPMFEADDKKHIHSKGKIGFTALTRIAGLPSEKMSPKQEPPTTVYEELKLSEKLSNKLSTCCRNL